MNNSCHWYGNWKKNVLHFPSKLLKQMSTWIFYQIMVCLFCKHCFDLDYIVNEAIAINVKLERQQKHHNCVVFSYQDELATTKKELMRLTTKLSIDQQANRMAYGDNSNTRDLEQQLKMVSILTLCFLHDHCTFSTATRHDCFIRETNGRVTEREYIHC